MMLNFRFSRCLLGLGAALSFIISFVIAAGVIPIVSMGASFRVGSGWLVLFFWAYIGFSSFAAGILWYLASRVSSLDRLLGILLGEVMLFTLLFCFVLSDAAFRFHVHDPLLQFVAVLLHLCSAADFVVALLIVTVAGLLPKQAAA
jgi:hypothetical protein